MPSLEPLQLGPELIAGFLLQRRPLLMIDGTEAFSPGPPRPCLKTFKNVSANEPVFDGHFPDLMLWPGIYTLEGLGQSTHLLALLVAFVESAEAKGVTRDEALKSLVTLHRMKRFGAVALTAEQQRLLDEVAREKPAAPAVTAAIDVKFHAPVFAGDRIDFTVELVRRVDSLLRFDVRAEVRGRLVLSGTHTGAVGLKVSGREQG